MVRGLVIGFLAGAVVTGVFFRLLQLRHAEGSDGAAPAATGGASGPGETKPGGLGADRTAAAGGDADALRKKIGELEAQLSAAKSGKSGDAKGGKSRAAEWKAIAEKILAARRDADANGGPMKNDLWFPLALQLWGEVANDMGVTLQEAAMSPDWYPILAMSLLDNSSVPLSAEQHREIDDVLAKAREKWSGYMEGKDSMTALERAETLRNLEFGTRTTLATIATKEQVDLIGSLGLPPPGPPVWPVGCGAGPRETVRQNLANNWQKTLGLDGNQVTTIGPVIDEYMRSYEAIQADVARRKTAGETVDDLAPKLRLMVEIQKRIGETVRLTDAQARALHDWGNTYDYQIKE